MSDVATETGLALPLSITNSSVLTLAGAAALPISLSQLLNKTRTAALGANAPGITVTKGAAGTGTVSGSSTAAVTGGVAPFAYAWSRVSGDASMTVTNGATATATISRSCADLSVNTAIYQCAISDSAAHSITITINVELDGYPAGAVTVTAPAVLVTKGTTGSGSISGSSTCTPGGGSGGYAYQWAYVSGVLFDITNATSQTAAFSKVVANNTTNSGVYKITVTDSGGRPASVNINVELDGYTF
jgi:hypothetical protein